MGFCGSKRTWTGLITQREKRSSYKKIAKHKKKNNLKLLKRKKKKKKERKRRDVLDHHWPEEGDYHYTKTWLGDPLNSATSAGCHVRILKAVWWCALNSFSFWKLKTTLFNFNPVRKRNWEVPAFHNNPIIFVRINFVYEQRCFTKAITKFTNHMIFTDINISFPSILWIFIFL